MALVENKNDLSQNVEVFENYLCEGSESESNRCRQLIKKGMCFIAYKVGNEVRFAPSRYIGYKNNTLKKHGAREKDGKETNVAINKILGASTTDEVLEKYYQKFCSNLGITPDNRKRKYWQLNFRKKVVSTPSEVDSEFPEGGLVERIHKARERNSKLVKQAKLDYINKYGRLFCEVCEFDFENVYGSRGKSYIEAHHDFPVSNMKQNQTTSVKDISMVCSNCHKIIHRTRPWLSVGGSRGQTP